MCQECPYRLTGYVITMKPYAEKTRYVVAFSPAGDWMNVRSVTRWRQAHVYASEFDARADLTKLKRSYLKRYLGETRFGIEAVGGATLDAKLLARDTQRAERIETLLDEYASHRLSGFDAFGPGRDFQKRDFKRFLEVVGSAAKQLPFVDVQELAKARIAHAERMW